LLAAISASNCASAQPPRASDCAKRMASQVVLQRLKADLARNGSKRGRQSGFCVFNQVVLDQQACT